MNASRTDGGSYLTGLLSPICAILLCFVNWAACGPTMLFLDSDDGVLLTRLDGERRIRVEKRRVMLQRLERKLIEEFKSKDELIAQYGAPKEFDRTELVRPLGANWIVCLENVGPDELSGLMERSHYVEVLDGVVILFLFSPDGEPYLPAVLFWKADEQFPSMTDRSQFDARLEWEQSRLDAVFSMIGANESEMTPTDEELQQDKEFRERLYRQFNELQRRTRQ